MKQQLNFQELYETAKKYFWAASGISDTTPEVRKKKMQQRSEQAWDIIKEQALTITFIRLFGQNCLGDQGAEWKKEDVELLQKATCGYLYYIEAPKQEAHAISLSVVYTIDIWIAALIMAAKEWLEHTLQKEGYAIVDSLAPGVDGVPLQVMEQWANYFREEGIDIKIKSNGLLEKENSLLALFLVC